MRRLSILSAYVLSACAALYGIEDRPSAEKPGSGDGSFGNDGGVPPLAVTPPSVTLEVGGAANLATADVAVDVRRGGLAGVVTGVVSDLPPGVTASTFAIAPDATHATVHVSAAPDAAPGSHPARVVAVAGAVSMTAPITVVVRGAPGTLDTSFGQGGILRVEGSSSLVSTLAREADGTFITGGCASAQLLGGFVVEPPWQVVRYLASGALDPSFGTNGSVSVSGDLANCVYALALQADGRIVVGGDGVPDAGPVLRRYGADGTVDPSFNASGGVGSPRAFAFAPDGAIVAALLTSTTAANGGSDLHVTVNRYTPAGAVVWSATAANVSNSQPRAVFVRPDGRILVVGDNETGVLLLQYTPDGKPDPSFGAAGTVVGSQPGTYVVSQDATLLADGRALIATTGNLLWRFDAQGMPDVSFGAGGKVTIPLPDGTATRGIGLTAVAVADDGKILTTSGANCSESGPFCQDLLLVRVDASGAPDTSFGAGGLSRASGVPTSTVALISFELDGRIRVLVAGARGSGEVTAVRFWP